MTLLYLSCLIVSVTVSVPLPQMRRNPPGAENAIDIGDDFVYSYYGHNSL